LAGIRRSIAHVKKMEPWNHGPFLQIKP
jgi:hypothetical protein